MIQFSPAAIAEINRLRSKSPISNAQLHLQVQPGGCLEWHYVLDFVDPSTENAPAMDCGALQVSIAPDSTPYVEDLTIDYSEDLMGGGFRFRNPKATQSCGCGNSFSLAS